MCLLRLAVGLQVLRSYRDWYAPILDQFGVLRAEYELALRNGMVFRFRPRVGDWHVVNQMWFSCPYLYEGHGIDAEHVVVDVGAHIGAFALRAAMFAPGVRVCAYEPSPANYRLLKRNIELNGLGGRIVASQSAVGGSRGRRRLYFDSMSAAGDSLCTPSPAGNGFAEVDCVALNDVFDQKGIERCGFLKMDCEGAEYEILAQTPDKYLRKVERISLEYHSIRGYGVGMLRERLEALDFRVAVISRPRILFASNCGAR
jgi:FkbM family methyltransferase